MPVQSAIDFGRPRLMINFVNQRLKNECSCNQIVKAFAKDCEDEEALFEPVPLLMEDKRALYILHNIVKKR